METDHLQGLGAFVRAVEAGSFTAAARQNETTPSAVSRSISRLEARLGTRLFHRSTRALSLTDEGRRYYEEVAPLLAALRDARDRLDPRAAMTGRLRVTLPADLGRLLIGPIAAVFVPAHPGVQLDLSLSDRRADVLREGFDLALRLGAPEDSSLHIRPLGELEVVLVASPGYLERAGEPRTPGDLKDHAHVRYRFGGAAYPIVFRSGERFVPEGVLDADNGEALRIAAVNDLGIAQLILPTVREDLTAGRLRRVLPDTPLPRAPLNFLHGFGRAVPPRARAFMDFVAARIGSPLSAA